MDKVPPESLPYSYVNEPILDLDSRTDAELNGDFDVKANRVENPKTRGKVLPLQVYFMQNNHAIWDKGESTVYAPTSIAADDLRESEPVYEMKLVRDGTIRGYILSDVKTKRQLLKVNHHGDTESKLSRALKGMINNPLNKFDVRNYGLYSDLKQGEVLGVIEEVYPDNRIFNPKQHVSPRLEMQNTRTLGAHYYLAVTDIPEPVGEVTSDIMGRFTARSEAYRIVLRNCTREEALIWIAMVMATDMKRRKTDHVRHGRV